jgi:hypothetical protein
MLSNWLNLLLKRKTFTKSSRAAGFKPALEMLEDRAVPATLTVGPTATYHTISDAITAAANTGDTINVNSGTYQEQLTIPSRFTSLTINSVTVNGAIIQAPTSMTDGLHAIVDINGATGVTIKNFEITGQTSGALELAGVYVEGSGSATISNNWITHLQSSNDSGVGILVGNLSGRHGMFTQGTATITGNTIDNYVKGGVVVVNKGSSATVGNSTAGNTITGIGPSSSITQYGVQISNGATGSVGHNVVTGNVHTDTTGAIQAAGILLYEAGSNITVSNNDLGSSANALPNGTTVPYSNDVGIWAIDASGAVISSNNINETKYDGIVLDSLSTSSGVKTVSNNDVAYSGGDGMLVFNTSSCTIANNNLTHNAYNGMWFALNDTGNTIKQNNSDSNGAFGILFADYDANSSSLEAYLTSSTSSGNTISQNNFTSNDTSSTTGVYDAEDFSTGNKTAGTADTWSGDTIGTKNPTGLK